MSFVIPVSDFLGWLHDIAVDVRGIVQEDALMSDQWPANLLNPN